jgi:predicted nicotinamide N-methyase
MKDRSVSRFRGYPVTVRKLTVASRTFELLVPLNCDALIDKPSVIERFERDEYVPYWAQVWPAGLLLADAVAAWGRVRGQSPRVLEIGCGLGLASLVLSHLGYGVLASDCNEDALAFVVENARRNHLPIPATRVLDWRETYSDLSVERIVAADVLYETRHLRPVAEFIQRHLAGGGFALVVDPNRTTAEDFGIVARHCGLAVRVTGAACPDPGADNPITGRVYRLHRSG